ncbi:uncharacterized protein BYT42DRAFT_576367, partial [Radiomyces spectabilis]|uniref:uncharacterized protein n=1 Tax=Radiomyces spectabilis TaxID=64574 RepID=UPI0022211EF5
TLFTVAMLAHTLLCVFPVRKYKWKTRDLKSNRFKKYLSTGYIVCRYVSDRDQVVRTSFCLE